MSISLSDLVIKFASYMHMRKNASKHTAEQDKNYELFCKLLENYKKGDNIVIPDNSAIPSIMSQYIRSVPHYEREETTFKTIYFMINTFNREYKEKNKS